MTETAFPEPHPAFAAHFTDPLYRDVSDDDAPFGNDEGWDILAEWADRRDELTDRSTVEQLFGAPLSQAVEDLEDFLVGSGFALILLTGRIDRDGREATLATLRRKDARWTGSNEIRTMIRDLEAFPAS